ncbi:MAG: aldolase/citrate lyase family protein [Bacilli bacterium]
MINLKERLKLKQPTFGSWINIGNQFIAEIMAQAGFEWIVVDMEHTSITFEQQQQLIQAIELSGSVPLVRVDSNNEQSIKKALDAGARGIIIPMINTLDDAKKALSYVYYPPRGVRGVGLSRAQKYGFGFEEYKKWLSSDCVVIAQIEHVDAIRNLKEILSLDGIDAFLIGPYDLSASLGKPGDFAQKEVVKALKQVDDISASINATKGYHLVHPTKKGIDDLLDSGYTFLALGVDEIYLGSSCRDIIEIAKKKVG